MKVSREYDIELYETSNYKVFFSNLFFLVFVRLFLFIGFLSPISILVFVLCFLQGHLFYFFLLLHFFSRFLWIGEMGELFLFLFGLFLGLSHFLSRTFFLFTFLDCFLNSHFFLSFGNFSFRLLVRFLLLPQLISSSFSFVFCLISFQGAFVVSFLSFFFFFFFTSMSSFFPEALPSTCQLSFFFSFVSLFCFKFSLCLFSCEMP